MGINDGNIEGDGGISNKETGGTPVSGLESAASELAAARGGGLDEGGTRFMTSQERARIDRLEIEGELDKERRESWQAILGENAGRIFHEENPRNLTQEEVRGAYESAIRMKEALLKFKRAGEGRNLLQEDSDRRAENDQES